MKKTVCILAAALLLCAAFVSCAGPGGVEAPPASIKIGLSVYDQHDTFVGVLTDHLQKLARERQQQGGPAISILYSNADNSQINQNYQIEGFIRDGCDILCVNLVDRTDASAIIDRAEAAGIPVLFFNRELVEEDLERWDELYYVGAFALESGRIQAEIVDALYRENPDAVDKNGDGVLQYVMLEGEAGHQDAVVRTQYAIGTLRELGHTAERLEDEIANWNAAQAETRMTAWLETHKNNIEIVFSNNDEMALGAISALHKAVAEGVIRQEDWPVIVGIDGTPTGLQAVLDGEMSGTAYNDSPGQARALLELAISLVQGTPLPEGMALIDGKYIRLPYQMITAENAAEFLAKTVP